MEFVVEEDGTLYILDAKPARRTPNASIKIAVDLVKDRTLTQREALMRVDATDALLSQSKIDDDVEAEVAPVFASGRCLMVRSMIAIQISIVKFAPALSRPLYNHASAIDLLL